MATESWGHKYLTNSDLLGECITKIIFYESNQTESTFWPTVDLWVYDDVNNLAAKRYRGIKQFQDELTIKSLVCSKNLWE